MNITVAARDVATYEAKLMTQNEANKLDDLRSCNDPKSRIAGIPTRSDVPAFPAHISVQCDTRRSVDPRAAFA